MSRLLVPRVEAAAEQQIELARCRSRASCALEVRRILRRDESRETA